MSLRLGYWSFNAIAKNVTWKGFNQPPFLIYIVFVFVWIDHITFNFVTLIEINDNAF